MSFDVASWDRVTQKSPYYWVRGFQGSLRLSVKEIAYTCMLYASLAASNNLSTLMVASRTVHTVKLVVLSIGRAGFSSIQLELIQVGSLVRTHWEPHHLGTSVSDLELCTFRTAGRTVCSPGDVPGKLTILLDHTCRVPCRSPRSR